MRAGHAVQLPRQYAADRGAFALGEMLQHRHLMTWQADMKSDQPHRGRWVRKMVRMRLMTSLSGLIQHLTDLFTRISFLCASVKRSAV